MQLDEFSRQLQLGMEGVRTAAASALRVAASEEPALAGLAVNDLLRLARDPRTPLSQQDDLWAAVLRRYRRTPDPVWTAIVLEMLAPELVDLAARISALHPRREPCDIQQQLVVETLLALRQMRGVPARFVKPQLSNNIRRRMFARLRPKLEGLSQSYEAIAEEDPASIQTIDDNAVWELAEIRLCNLRRQDLALAALDFFGKTLEEAASELGCSAEALRSRIRRARNRLQPSLAA